MSGPAVLTASTSPVKTAPVPVPKPKIVVRDHEDKLSIDEKVPVIVLDSRVFIS
jgi:hypothetical protein